MKKQQVVKEYKEIITGKVVEISQEVLVSEGGQGQQMPPSHLEITKHRWGILWPRVQDGFCWLTP